MLRIIYLVIYWDKYKISSLVDMVRRCSPAISSDSIVCLPTLFWYNLWSELFKFDNRKPITSHSLVLILLRPNFSQPKCYWYYILPDLPYIEHNWCIYNTIVFLSNHDASIHWSHSSLFSFIATTGSITTKINCLLHTLYLNLITNKSMLITK